MTIADPKTAARRLTDAKRIVVKVGSALLVDAQTGRLNRGWLETFAADVARLRRRGQEVILVSSGAIALGRRHLNLSGAKLRLEESQAAAAVGQIRLAHAYKELLEVHDITVAQILLTLGDTELRRRYLNARGTLNTLLSLGAVPVINENDTVATAEIRYGDNDRLAARVAQMVSADCLILLSDIDGLYTANPQVDPDAQFIACVLEISPAVEAMAGGASSSMGSGGMQTKIAAAKIAVGAGCHLCIAKGASPNPLQRIEEGVRCTWFVPSSTPVATRKQWIAGTLKPAGAVAVDEGAVRALMGGKSLLPAGVTRAVGRFDRGDTVSILGPDGCEVARGICAYSDGDAARIIGRKSTEIEKILGFRGRDEIVHRDDLVLLESAMISNMEQVSVPDLMLAIGHAARAAAAALNVASTDQKNHALRAAAAAVRAQQQEIIAANRRDLRDAASKELSAALLDRLKLDETRVEAMARGLEDIACLEDPIGAVLAQWSRPNGMVIQRLRVPLGVIGIIYESRPNVTADAGALCLKSSNAVILRGGSESLLSSTAIHACLVEGLRAAGLPPTCIQLVPTTDRAAVGYLLSEMMDTVDVIVPRGGKSLVERVQREARVPVIGHLEGVCHVYVDRAADLSMAQDIVLNAKLRRTGVCGAAETLLVDRACAGTHLPALVRLLLEAGCEVRGDETCVRVDERVRPATEQDWYAEYLDAIIAVRVVDDVDAAIAHIAQYGSQHTDCIVTANAAAAERFLARVDSAIVLHNASTQFADGGEFGMGAEIGISTDKFHARGPVGVEQLTSYKYLIRGSGQIRA